MSKTIAVIGAGSWGTALATVLAENNVKVQLWTRERDLCETINVGKENRLFLPGIPLAEEIRAVSSLREAVTDVEAVIIVVPSRYVRGVLAEFSPLLQPDSLILSACKGIEEETLTTVSEIIKTECSGVHPDNIAVLSGPNFAREIAKKLPAAAAIASVKRETAEYFRTLFSTSWFKIFINNDPVGVEMGGALKNVIAIASGIADGLEFGHNSRAALITRGLNEISRLGSAMGARAETFLGLSGVGDLVLTCTGSLSRNRTVGLELAKGKNIEAIQNEMKMVAEGIFTVRSAYKLGKKFKVRISIIDEVYRIIYEQKEITTAISDLLERDIVDEF